jgi:Bacterial dnaA protein helix-turn-helix
MNQNAMMPWQAAARRKTRRRLAEPPSFQETFPPHAPHPAADFIPKSPHSFPYLRGGALHSWRGERRLRESRLSSFAEATVALAFAQTFNTVRAPTRSIAEHAFVRQLAVYMTNTTFAQNFTAIGRTFGRERSTISHACTLVESARQTPHINTALVALDHALREWMRQNAF